MTKWSSKRPIIVIGQADAIVGHANHDLRGVISVCEFDKNCAVGLCRVVEARLNPIHRVRDGLKNRKKETVEIGGDMGSGKHGLHVGLDQGVSR